jgi:muconolactone delta-isomerase
VEFLVEFEVEVPAGAPDADVEHHQRAESAAAAKLAEDGHLVRLCTRPLAGDGTTAIGLYRAGSKAELGGLLAALPRWLAACHGHAAPGAPQRSRDRLSMSARLPDPSLTRVYRLEATAGEPLDLGDIAQGHRRIAPLTGGTFTGPELTGKLLPRSSADWQILLPDRAALGDIGDALRTDDGDLRYVQSRGVRHGSADVLEPLARGGDVDAAEYTFRTSVEIETAALALDWLNNGVFISVGGRRPGAVIYETCLAG